MDWESGMFVMPARKTLEWADVYPFLYLHSAFEGLKESGITKHLVVDEMQDYTPVQYAALNRMFPCRKTILWGISANLLTLTIYTVWRISGGSMKERSLWT